VIVVAGERVIYVGHVKVEAVGDSLGVLVAFLDERGDLADAVSPPTSVRLAQYETLHLVTRWKCCYACEREPRNANRGQLLSVAPVDPIAVLLPEEVTLDIVSVARVVGLRDLGLADVPDLVRTPGMEPAA